MSIFDFQDSIVSFTNEVKFFKKFPDLETEQRILLKPIIFQCPISYRKNKSGKFQGASIKIMEDKLVIIKASFRFFMNINKSNSRKTNPRSSWIFKRCSEQNLL